MRTRQIAVLLSALGLASPAFAAGDGIAADRSTWGVHDEAAPAARTIDVAPVWPGHPVGFALLTVGERQYVGFYNHERRLVVGARELGSDEWSFEELPQTTGWDSHNSITMAADREGHLHLTADMHVTPLVYFRTSEPGEIASFERLDRMVGEKERRCTYPAFLNDADGALIFTYRDGGSGNGNQIYNRYDGATKSWSRLLDKPLLDGQGQRNAYATTPAQGPDGRFHMVWVWRDTPDAATNHNVSYARSPDLLHWENAAGDTIELPITLETGDVVDPVPPRGGTINNNVHVGFDHENRPIVSYHKYDEAGNTQIYNARFENGRWVTHRASDWDYRWDFGGGGSIHFELTLSPVHTSPDGRLVQTYTHSQHGEGGWVLDPESLKVTGPYEPPAEIPERFAETESDHPGMSSRFAHDLGGGGDSRYILRWETLGANRDRPRRGELPPPSMLRVIELPKAGGGQD